MKKETENICHREDLEKIRNLVTLLFEHLEEDIEGASSGEKVDKKFLWGGSETAVSILTKLSQILLKLIPAEHDLSKESSGTDTESIAKEDIEILEQYVKRRIEEKRADQTDKH